MPGCFDHILFEQEPQHSYGSLVSLRLWVSARILRSDACIHVNAPIGDYKSLHPEWDAVHDVDATSKRGLGMKAASEILQPRGDC